MSTPCRHGFTLIELSIVLVIVGLVVGGVLVGQYLIRAAELRNMISDKEKFVTAVYSFRTKYNALPGDFADAQSIWGAAAACSSAETTMATCNGDGNGKIDARVPTGTLGNEIFLFWKQLANAGLIQGSYIGISDGAGSFATTARNAPSGKIPNSLWYTENWGTIKSSSWAFNGEYGNIFEYGFPIVNANPYGDILTAAEMLAIDTKIDDGKPGNGLLVVVRDINCDVKADGVTPAAATDVNTAIYNTSSFGNQCHVIFRKIW